MKTKEVIKYFFDKKYFSYCTLLIVRELLHCAIPHCPLLQYSLFTAHRPSPSLASSQPSSLVSRLGSTEDLYCDDELRSLATSDPVNMRLLDPGLAIQPGDSAWPGTEPGDDGGLGTSASN